jgi:hypothetical protein
MIVSRRKEGLLLVKQYDHGTLTGDFAARWGNDRFDRPGPYDSCHLAAAMHDEGWRAWDDKPALNPAAHRPAHFLEVPLHDSVIFYKGGVDAVYARDEYAGLLVGMHWGGLYRGRWGLQGSPAAPPAPGSELDQLKADTIAKEEARWVAAKHRLLGPDDIRSEFEGRLWHNYELLQVYDLLSLFMCMTPLDVPSAGGETKTVGQTLAAVTPPPGSRSIPKAPTSLAGARADLVLEVLGEGIATVDPWPFDRATFSLAVPAVLLPEGEYASVADVRAAMLPETRLEIACEFRPKGLA